MTAGDDVLLGQRGGRVFARISGDAATAAPWASRTAA
jgi:hypothetical protein